VRWRRARQCLHPLGRRPDREPVAQACFARKKLDAHTGQAIGLEVAGSFCGGARNASLLKGMM